MRITKLSLTGLRALKQADFEFHPGMNLLVGVNGVGKTTVLDALCISLTKIFPTLFGIKISKKYLEIRDVKIGMSAAQVSCDFEYVHSSINLLFTKKNEKTLVRDTSTNREIYVEVPEVEQINPSGQKLLPNQKSNEPRPLGVYYSTKRSILVNQKTSTHSIVGGLTAALSDAFKDRETNLTTIAEWYKVQQELSDENPIGTKHVKILNDAIEVFIPEFKNLKISETKDKLSFNIDKKGITLNLDQLSDGERGVLSIILDLAKRLSQANPNLENPLKDGSAIVLIDELDLHLHPKWQRTIVDNLTRTFPNCQFIATTHSPQIIPSVEPEQVILLKDNEVILPDRTKGMDSNWILKFLMDSEDRPQEAIDAIAKIEVLIKQNKFNEARAYIADYRTKNLDLTEWSMFDARIARLEVFNKSK